jgi:pullulanase/glycogen debranching enzyme
MGHQPRAAMERLKWAVDSAVGRDVQLLGEGWNFGEVANGVRFVQASQLSLNGSGIATFSDRARDAVRGGSAGDNGADQMRRQGYINGLFYAPNAMTAGLHRASDLMQSADMVRVGLAGSIRGYPMRNYLDTAVTSDQIGYGGSQPAGYVSEPGEVVNYVENHDNQTLFDLNAFKLPVDTSREDRARVQMLGAAINAFSQGISYFHAGVDTLRSKSMDRNSYDSGDWFNRIDWSYTDNYFGTGLPPRQDNQQSWSLMRPLLANAGIRPTSTEIAWTRDAFRDLLRIRKSSALFRLRSADDIRARLTLLNTGSAQQATVVVGHLRGDGLAGAGFAQLLYLINVDRMAHTVVLETERGKNYVLHPVHRTAGAADRRPLEQAQYDAGTGRFNVPARTAVVYVVE